MREVSEGVERDRCWNHNTIYYPVVLGAVPPGSQRALDVGCGEGMLTRQLGRLVPEVVGTDTDEASIAAASRGTSRTGTISAHGPAVITGHTNRAARQTLSVLDRPRRQSGTGASGWSDGGRRGTISPMPPQLAREVRLAMRAPSQASALSRPAPRKTTTRARPASATLIS